MSPVKLFPHNYGTRNTEMWIQQSIRTTGSSDEQREDGYLFPNRIEV